MILLPWKILHSSDSYEEHVRFIYGQDIALSQSYIHYFKASKSAWGTGMKETYNTLAEAKEATDQKLIDNGHTLLTEEQMKRLEILL